MSVDSYSAGTPPAVTVIIPTLERRDLVRRAVKSVLAQRFHDFEVIVVDGGSSDGTAEALAGMDPRVRFVCEPRPTVSAARNVGLRLARAPLIAFLDSDDRWLPDHLEMLTAALERYPEAVLATSCPGFRIGGRESARHARPIAYPSRDVNMGLVGYTSCVVVRRDALEAVGRFNEQLAVGEDSELWLRLAFQGPFCILRRRTLLKQHTRAGLMERGVQSGGYLDAIELIARTAIDWGERAASPEGGQLSREAKAILPMVSGMRALARRDDEAVRAALQEACTNLPELSRRVGLVTLLLERVPARTREERLQHVATTAALWPTQAADAALYLRGSAAVLALRLGHIAEATRLLKEWPLRRTPGFLCRVVPFWIRKTRRRIDRALHSGSDKTPVG